MSRNFRVQDYSTPSEKCDICYCSQPKQQNFRFCRDPVISSPPSYKYYSNVVEETITPGLEKSWKSVYSSSTLADSKQLNENSSSVLLDYNTQAVNKENEFDEEEYENDNSKEFVYREKLTQEAQTFGQENLEQPEIENWEDEEEEDEYGEEYQEEGYEETYDEAVEGEGYTESPQEDAEHSYWANNVEGEHENGLAVAKGYENVVADKLLDTDDYSTNFNRAARSTSLNYPFMHGNNSLEEAAKHIESRDVISRFNYENFQKERKPKFQVTFQDAESEFSSPTEFKQTKLVSFPIDNSNLNPYTLEQIDSRIEIRFVPEKGRCAFARMNYKPGDVIFIELPTLVATPDLDNNLWKQLSELNEQKAFELPPVWHLAALYSLKKLPAKDKKIIFEKWVPNIHKEPTEDVLRVINHTKLNVSAQQYERALQVWRYNSFGHHVSSDGLVLYNRISMLSHDCAASACWHYGMNDAFTLRARKYIPKGTEITISYIGDEDLLKASHIRQEKLSGWLFKCACERCESVSDTPRGFRCPTCGAGAVFFKTNKYPVDSVTPEATQSTCCTLCKAKPSNEDLRLYLHLEEAYIARLSETSKNELVDAEHVYSEAQRVFVQHWVLYQLDTILFEAYREQSRWQDAAFHQSNRIRYVIQVVPEVSYTLAWLYEELGDLLARNVGLIVTGYEQAAELQLNGFQKNSIVNNYETAMNLLLVLCGQEHEYTIAAHEKLETVFDAGKRCFEEEEEEET